MLIRMAVEDLVPLNLKRNTIYHFILQDTARIRCHTKSTFRCSTPSVLRGMPLAVSPSLIPTDPGKDTGLVLECSKRNETLSA